jgi:hypothetical protein
MADSMSDDRTFNPFDPAEPARDAELGALLRRVEGDVPMAAVDWNQLASRISRSLPPRMSTSWWSYAARWERRMLPLALAAGLAGLFALWNGSESTAAATRAGTSEIIADMVQGAPAEDVARTFARSLTADVTVAYGEPVQE